LSCRQTDRYIARCGHFGIISVLSARPVERQGYDSNAGGVERDAMIDVSKISVADLLGPFVENGWGSGLIERCRTAWSKPLLELTNEELATLLRQRIAVDHLVPIAEKRLREGVDDGTEMYDGELEGAVRDAIAARKDR
jgi:hypothetical protein